MRDLYYDLIELKYKHINRSKNEETREALRNQADDMIVRIKSEIEPVQELDLTFVRMVNEKQI